MITKMNFEEKRKIVVSILTQKNGGFSLGELKSMYFFFLLLYTKILIKLILHL